MSPTVRKAPEWNDVTKELTPAQTVALTILGEAMPGSLDAMRDVGAVIRNRLALGRWGDSYKDVCLAPWQFSTWREAGGRKNYERIMRHARILLDPTQARAEDVIEAIWVAEGIMTGMLRDSVSGATHYYAPLAMVPKGKVPSWAKHQTPVKAAHGHVFFTGIS
ncbi:MAG TPA: cell wall hydrolase [Candidatus Binatia bacterium]|nr:cell wall hydrolase [Candidatus Binatia bacterium]